MVATTTTHTQCTKYYRLRQWAVVRAAIRNYLASEPDENITLSGQFEPIQTLHAPHVINTIHVPVTKDRLVTSLHYGSHDVRSLVCWTYDTHTEKHVNHREQFLYDVTHVLVIKQYGLIVLGCADLMLRVVYTRSSDRFQIVIATRLDCSVTCLAFNEVLNHVLVGTSHGLHRYKLVGAAHRNVTPLPTLTLGLAEFEWIKVITFYHYKQEMLVQTQPAVYIFNYMTNQLERRVAAGLERSITAHVFFPDLSYLITGLTNGALRVWDSRTLMRVHDFRGHSEEITSLSIMHSDSLLFSTSRDCSILIWRLDTLQLEQHLHMNNPVLGLELVNEGTYLYYWTDRDVSMCRTARYHSLYTSLQASVRSMHRCDVTGMPGQLVVGLEDGSVQILSPVTATVLTILYPLGGLQYPNSLTYDRVKGILFALWGHNEILVVNCKVNPCKVFLKVECPGHVPTCMTSLVLDRALGFQGCPDENLLVLLGCTDGRIRLLSGNGFSLTHSVQAHQAAVCTLGCSSAKLLTLDRMPANLGPGVYPENVGRIQDADRLITCGEDGEIKVWALRLVDEVKVDLLVMQRLLVDKPPNVVCLLHQTLALACHQDGVLRMYRLFAFTKRRFSIAGAPNPGVKELKHSSELNHDAPIISLDQCSSRGIFMTTGSDGLLKLWNVYGDLIRELTFDCSLTHGCFVNARGDIVVGYQSRIHLVPLETAFPMDVLEQMAWGNIKDDVPEDPVELDENTRLWIEHSTLPTRYLQLTRSGGCLPLNAIRAEIESHGIQVKHMLALQNVASKESIDLTAPCWKPYAILVQKHTLPNITNIFYSGTLPAGSSQAKITSKRRTSCYQNAKPVAPGLAANNLLGLLPGLAASGLSFGSALSSLNPSVTESVALSVAEEDEDEEGEGDLDKRKSEVKAARSGASAAPKTPESFQQLTIGRGGYIPNSAVRKVMNYEPVKYDPPDDAWKLQTAYMAGEKPPSPEVTPEVETPETEVSEVESDFNDISRMYDFDMDSERPPGDHQTSESPEDHKTAPELKVPRPIIRQPMYRRRSTKQPVTILGTVEDDDGVKVEINEPSPSPDGNKEPLIELFQKKWWTGPSDTDDIDSILNSFDEIMENADREMRKIDRMIQLGQLDEDEEDGQTLDTEPAPRRRRASMMEPPPGGRKRRESVVASTTKQTSNLKSSRVKIADEINMEMIDALVKLRLNVHMNEEQQIKILKRIEAQCRHKRPKLRITAVRALAKLEKSDKVICSVLPLLADIDTDVRSEASEAITEITGIRNKDELLDLLKELGVYEQYISRLNEIETLQQAVGKWMGKQAEGGIPQAFIKKGVATWKRRASSRKDEIEDDVADSLLSLSSGKGSQKSAKLRSKVKVDKKEDKNAQQSRRGRGKNVHVAERKNLTSTHKEKEAAKQATKAAAPVKKATTDMTSEKKTKALPKIKGKMRKGRLFDNKEKAKPTLSAQELWAGKALQKPKAAIRVAQAFKENEEARKLSGLKIHKVKSDAKMSSEVSESAKSFSTSADTTLSALGTQAGTQLEAARKASISTYRGRNADIAVVLEKTRTDSISTEKTEASPFLQATVYKLPDVKKMREQSKGSTTSSGVETMVIENTKPRLISDGTVSSGIPGVPAETRLRMLAKKFGMAALVLPEINLKTRERDGTLKPETVEQLQLTSQAAPTNESPRIEHVVRRWKPGSLTSDSGCKTKTDTAFNLVLQSQNTAGSTTTTTDTGTESTPAQLCKDAHAQQRIKGRTLVTKLKPIEDTENVDLASLNLFLNRPSAQRRRVLYEAKQTLIEHVLSQGSVADGVIPGAATLQLALPQDIKKSRAMSMQSTPRHVQPAPERPAEQDSDTSRSNDLEIGVEAAVIHGEKAEKPQSRKTQAASDVTNDQKLATRQRDALITRRKTQITQDKGAREEKTTGSDRMTSLPSIVVKRRPSALNQTVTVENTSGVRMVDQIQYQQTPHRPGDGTQHSDVTKHVVTSLPSRCVTQTTEEDSGTTSYGPLRMRWTKHIPVKHRDAIVPLPGFVAMPTRKQLFSSTVSTPVLPAIGDCGSPDVTLSGKPSDTPSDVIYKPIFTWESPLPPAPSDKVTLPPLVQKLYRQRAVRDALHAIQDLQEACSSSSATAHAQDYSDVVQATLQKAHKDKLSIKLTLPSISAEQ